MKLIVLLLDRSWFKSHGFTIRQIKDIEYLIVLIGTDSEEEFINYPWTILVKLSQIIKYVNDKDNFDPDDETDVEQFSLYTRFCSILKSSGQFDYIAV